MVVAGLAKAQMTETFATAIEKKDLPAIESEPMCYLLSKLGYADDSNKRWLFHLRFFYLGNRPRNRGGSKSAWFSHPWRERRFGAPWLRWSLLCNAAQTERNIAKAPPSRIILSTSTLARPSSTTSGRPPIAPVIHRLFWRGEKKERRCRFSISRTTIQ